MAAAKKPDTSTLPELPDTPRSRQVTDAAISVLAQQGSRGLTHRAVDRAAGLPEGATSNLYRTRDALMAATLSRHAAREIEIAEAVTRTVSPNSIEEAATFLTAAVNSFTADDSATELVAARYELYLEGRRHPEFRQMLAQVRESFIGLASAVITELGLKDSREGATAVIALVDGLTANQMYHPEFALTTEQLTQVISSQLRGLTRN
jgi:DNA-binding transcriptional regulator YbjK